MSWKSDPYYLDIADKAEIGRVSGHGSFSRFRIMPEYTWAEYIMKRFLDERGIKYVHRWRFRTENGWLLEYDFYLPTHAIAIEVDPGFHQKTDNPVTRNVFLRDRDKDDWSKQHGIELIRIQVHPKINDFVNEVNKKLARRLHVRPM